MKKEYVVIIIVCAIAIFEAGIIVGLPKIETIKTVIETNTENPEAIWVVESFENDTLSTDVYVYNESYDVYIKLDKNYTCRSTIFYAHNWAELNYALTEYELAQSVIGGSWKRTKVIDDVCITTPALWNINADGFTWENLRN